MKLAIILNSNVLQWMHRCIKIFLFSRSSVRVQNQLFLHPKSRCMLISSKQTLMKCQPAIYSTCHLTKDICQPHFVIILCPVWYKILENYIASNQSRHEIGIPSCNLELFRTLHKIVLQFCNMKIF